MRPLFLLVPLALALAPLPAQAGMGPCVPDRHEGFVCGEGQGAARVIDGTRSPDKRFAFAWRDPLGTPNDQPDGDGHDLLLVRLADGGVRAKSRTGYWSTGEMRANRLAEEIAWSPDSRLAVRASQQRFDTERFELFALDGEAPAAIVDLKAIVEPALRKRLKHPDYAPESFALWVHGGKHLTVGKAGLVRFTAMMWVPKDGPNLYFDVSLRVKRAQGGVAARLASVRPGKDPERR